MVLLQQKKSTCKEENLWTMQKSLVLQKWFFMAPHMSFLGHSFQIYQLHQHIQCNEFTASIAYAHLCIRADLVWYSKSLHHHLKLTYIITRITSVGFMTRARTRAIRDGVDFFQNMCDSSPSKNDLLPQVNTLCVLKYEP
jgi:hypothetical protein